MKILSKFFFVFLSLVIPFSLCSFKNREVENFNETSKTFIFSDKTYTRKRVRLY